MSQSYLHAVNAVDGGVTGWGAAQGSHQRIWNKTHMHEVVLYRFRQVKSYQDRALSDV